MVTPQQQEQLWTWCGFTDAGWSSMDSRRQYQYPEGFLAELPPLTLENLVKWARPKLTARGIRMELELMHNSRATLRDYATWNTVAVACADDPAEALAKALLNLIKSEEAKK